MADIFSKKKRSKIMSGIKSSRTKPELFLKEQLDGRIFRYQPKIYGKPDFGSKKYRIAIFVDGRFWHGCPGYALPLSNQQFWIKKIEKNKARDQKHNRELKRMGYLVLRFWDCDVLKAPLKVTQKINSSILQRRLHTKCLVTSEERIKRTKS
jgi:DNA mismatch endonuclease (patch repair protein)